VLTYDNIAELAPGDDGRFGLQETPRFNDPVKCCAPVTVIAPALESAPLAGDDAGLDPFDDDAAADDVEVCEPELLEPHALATTADASSPTTAAVRRVVTRGYRAPRPDERCGGRPAPRSSPTIRISHPRLRAFPVGPGAEYPGPRPE
jgi:hypothetical protein